ncbi:hypothetical protein FHQ09_18480, partial [Brevibacterium sediminis]
VVPALGAVACAFLMVNLGGRTWIVFGAWMVVGAIVYFTYSRRQVVRGVRGGGLSPPRRGTRQRRCPH